LEQTNASPTSDERLSALNRALGNIEKDFGKGSIMKLGERSGDNNLDVVPTGSLSLDVALGIGGIPRGRIIEIYGPESSGKTTVTLHIIANVQKFGGIAAFIDAEHALDPLYAKKLGVNIEELYISQPDDGEQALDIAEELVRSHAIDIVVIDSVAALTPRAEIEGEMGASHMGLQARLMSQALRKLTAFCGKSNCIIIFTNQLRDKIGITYGSPETTTGGRALKFYASIRLDIRKADTLKQGADLTGNRTKVKVAKNKLAPPFKLCEFDIIYGEGISRDGDILDLAIEMGLANKSGSWFSYGETRLGQGRENAKLYFRDNPEIAKELEDKIREHYKLKTFDQLAAIHESVSKPSGAASADAKAADKGKAGKKKGAKDDAKEEEFEIEAEMEEYDK